MRRRRWWLKCVWNSRLVPESISLGMSEHNCYFEGHLWPDIVHSRTAEQGLTHPWVWLCHSWSLTTKPGDKANNNCQTTLFISKVFFGCWFCFSRLLLMIGTDETTRAWNMQMDFAAVRTGPHIFPTGTRGRVWTLGPCLKVHFSAASQHCSAGPLNCCKVSSHTHLTLLSHWVQPAFVTSTQQGFPLASVSTQALGGWLPALQISSFAPAAFLKATDLLPSVARDKSTVKIQTRFHFGFSNKKKEREKKKKTSNAGVKGRAKDRTVAG